MKKKIISIILIIALIMPSVVLAADTTQDYGDITKFSSDYSYGTLFWTEDTEVITLDDNNSTPEDTNGQDNSYKFTAKPGTGKVSVKITKCAVDKAGDLCDVICKISNIKEFSADNIRKDDDGNDLSAASLDIAKYGSTDLIRFWFNTVSAEGHFTMQYVKTGTTTPAKVEYAAASMGDIDVTHDDKIGDLWLGSEGFTLDGAEGDVYYKKGNWLTDTSDEKGVRTPNRHGTTINKYATDDSGNQIENTKIADEDKTKNLVEKDNDLDLYNSAVVTENMGQDATFKLFYSGYGCGILYLFASPYAFELDNPIKSANKTIAADGDKYTYTIKQYVPNNYYASQLNFIPNSEGKYSSFTIEDTLDSNIELDGETTDIKVVNESNKNVTFFDITKTDNKITATAKTDALANTEFYAHTYSINIPVKVKSLADKDISKIENKATTTAKIGQNEPETKESNTVEVNIKYTVVFDTNGGTTPPDDQIVSPGEKATNPSYTGEKPGYTFSGWSTTDPDTETAQEYVFDTPVNENKTLYAIWTPNEYRINYELNATDATPDSSNPTKYTTGIAITSFKEPTRPGYTFGGWYANEELTTEFPGIKVDDYGDKTLYAKWTPTSEDKVSYKVEHYLETLDGKYELDTNSIEDLSDEPGKTVTATPKAFAGYIENTNHEDRVATGTVDEDGKLVLKLFYDLEEYKVTFDTKGGSPKPEDQTKKYGEKAVKPTNPTVEGYTFKGWYYLNSENKEAQYNFDDPVTHDINLYAKWESFPKEEDKEVTSKQADSSTSPKILPNTGKTTAIALSLGICAVAILGKKYYNLRDINK